LGLLAVACGDDGGATASPTPPEPSTTVPAGPTSLDDPDDGRPRVLIAGDSVLAEAARPLAHALETTGAAHAGFLLAPKLPRTPSEAALWATAVEGYDPDVVVLSIGHWESQALLGDFARGDYLEPGRYRRDLVDPAVATLTAGGAEVLWVGPTAIRDPEETALVGRLEEDYRAVAAERDDVAFADGDTWVAPDGYTDTLPGPDGTPVAVRRADGIHLCPDGQVLMAQGLLGALAPTIGPVDPGWVRTWEATRPSEPGGCAPDYVG